MISQAVNISVDGSQMDSYLARPPEGSGPHPAVIVLQEVFGVNDEMRRQTIRHGAIFEFANRMATGRCLMPSLLQSA